MARVWYIRKRPLKFDEISKLYLKLLSKVQLFSEGHKNVRNHPYGFEIYWRKFFWPSQKS